jgi:hypothetical protein
MSSDSRILGLTWSKSDVLRIHLLEYVADAFGVVLGHREDDGLARKLTALIQQAVLHDVLPLSAQRITVADEHFDVRARVVDLDWVDALLDKAVPVVFVEVHAFDAIALEAGLRLIEAEVPL